MSSNPPLRKKLRKYFAQSGDTTVPTFQPPCPSGPSAGQSRIISTGETYNAPPSDAKNDKLLSWGPVRAPALPLSQFPNALPIASIAQLPACPAVVQASHAPSSSCTPDLTASTRQVLSTSQSCPTPRPTLPATEPVDPLSLSILDNRNEPQLPSTTPLTEGPEKLFNTPASSLGSSHSSKAPPSAYHASNASLRLKNSLKALGRIASVVPNFKATLDILADGIDLVPETVQRRREYEQLASDASMAATGLEKHLNQMSPGQMSECVASVASELKAHAEYASKKQERRSLRSYLEAEQDADDVIACYRRIEALFRQLQATAILSVWRTTNENTTIVNEHIAETRLKGLNPVIQARYDSAVSGDLRGGLCTPNTRVSILQDLRNWATNPNGANVYWINGMAGTGKTTIAYSLCSELKASGHLAASFFSSRLLHDCQDATRIVPTIAYQLARLSRPFQNALVDALGKDPDLGTSSIETQFEKLINDPLLRTNGNSSINSFVVVIDALDECSNRAGAHSLLSALLRFAPGLPIKFCVTSRPEGSLIDKLLSGSSLSRSVLHLHNIEESLVQADIKTYLRVALAPIGVSEFQVRRLAELSGKLFIYAATAVRYILPNDTPVDPHRRLDMMLNTSLPANSIAHEAIDELYTTILSAALENKKLETSEIENAKLVLHTVISARMAMTVEALAGLLKLENVRDVRFALEPLRSLLNVSSVSGLVSVLHVSFSDYMLSRERSGRFFCDIEEHSGLLAEHCFDTMEKLLRFNICGLESSFVLDKDVPGLATRLETAVPPHLFYACHYWKDHLIKARSSKILIALLDQFLRCRVLFWMEVMNLGNCVRACPRIMSELHRWLQSASAPETMCRIAQDVHKYATIISTNVVSMSTPHIYISVLPLWERDSPMWVHYGRRMRGLVGVEGTAINKRDMATLAIGSTDNPISSIAISNDGARVISGCVGGPAYIWDAYTMHIFASPFGKHGDSGDSFRSVAFSPDSAYIVSTSAHYSICIYDAHTGHITVGPLSGHSKSVNSVAFSPDGGYVVSGSADHTIRVWDAHTGQSVVGPLKGHSKSVNSVAFSPDGGRIVSGSDDCTICVWSAHEGIIITGPLEGHSKSIKSVAVSPGGGQIISGSTDGTIRIWDSSTGRPTTGSLKGHMGPVNSVVFSQDGSQIISGSDDRTVRIWDAATGQVAIGPLGGHSGPVNSVVFSSNSGCAISGSADGTIRVWDIHTSRESADSPEGHSGSVRSLAFSPGGNRIISGSDDQTIRVWDAHTGQMLIGPLEGHKNSVTTVAFLPDGDRAVSSSADHAICIWDADTGRPMTGLLKGHSHSIASPLFLPDGGRIISDCWDGTIFTWDAPTGYTLQVGRLKGCTSLVSCVAFSPDGNRIIAGSSDGTIRVWNAETGRNVLGVLKGHSSFVWSAAFSPDGARIASGSADRTIRLWNARTGHPLTGPLIGHTDWVGAVAFSPDGSRIISGSGDGTIRIWDSHTGHRIAGPLKGHTSSVKSIAFSPEGDRIASGSDDCTIRIWEAHGDSYITSHRPEDWSVNADGWIVNRDSQLLLWVPLDLRARLRRPQDSRVIIHARGCLNLNFADALLGSRWQGSYMANETT